MHKILFSAVIIFLSAIHPAGAQLDSERPRWFVIESRNGEDESAAQTERTEDVAEKSEEKPEETQDRLSAEKLQTVEVKERKNGIPTWYEDKNSRGDFVLKDRLKNKEL